MSAGREAKKYWPARVVLLENTLCYVMAHIVHSGILPDETRDNIDRLMQEQDKVLEELNGKYPEVLDET